MKNIMVKIGLMIALGMTSTLSFGHIGPSGKKQATGPLLKDLESRAICQPGVAEIDQSINNVRARLSTGGDVWWDRSRGLYIVPKPSEDQLPVSAIFAGGVWVGGQTRAGSLKLAGVTYRSLTANFDWYPGPLDVEGVTESEVCKDWDRFFRVFAKDALPFIANWEKNPDNFDCDSIPNDIKYWPGRDNPYWSEKYDFELPDQAMGSFWDEDGDGVYDPCAGDFPTIDIRRCEPETRKKAKELIPDEMIFWLYNDNGGPHRLTGGSAIQMEVQVQAFAYATNDEVNDMTFQRYKLINKANEDLIDCYFAMWVDPDLGCYEDDYIGCDMTVVDEKPRSLAYTYNEDAVDGINGANCGGVNTYGEVIPIVGTDYFRGPRGPKIFKRDSNGNVLKDTVLLEPIPGSGEVDTLVELGMTSFIYTNNCGVGDPAPQTCDPSNSDEQYYNNIRGLWISGDPVTFGATGFNPGSTDTVRYVFPDPPSGTGWSMCRENLPRGDRRTLQATGPLLLQPGATNELIIGVVFVPDLDYPCPDIERLLSADDIAQSLFDNCFDITDGPDAPDICAVELDKEIIFAVSNDRFTSNNPFLSYEEQDLRAPNDSIKYKFEGYKIYQLADAGVSPQEIDDVSKAKLIFQTDIKNGVRKVFNWKSELFAGDDNIRVWTYETKVDGSDLGIQNTFDIREDQFAKSDRKLVNHKQYHFMVVAYAYNNYQDFDPKTEVGQRTQYLEGRRNVKVYSFTPRPIVYQNINSKYNDGAAITRLSGQGTGKNFLDLEEGMHEAILNGTTEGKLKYKEGFGPISVKVFNPLEIVNGKFRLELKGEFNPTTSICQLKPGATWIVTDLTTNEVIASEQTIDKINEQLIAKKGFSVKIGQENDPGVIVEKTDNNGAIGQTITYKDGSGPKWLLNMGDDFGGPNSVLDPILPNRRIPQDSFGRFNSLGSGQFFPFYSSRWEETVALDQFFVSPALLENNGQKIITSPNGNLKLRDLNNVDIVFTSNKDLWSRCIVVETASPFYYSLSGFPTLDNTKMFDVRVTPSVGKDGKPDGSGTAGLSWFPGYAIDVETGKRLNIFFGENSSYNGNYAQLLENPSSGIDMIFNPGSQVAVNGPNSLGPLRFPVGGQHFIYVTRQAYDACDGYSKKLAKTVATSQKYGAISGITWTCIPLLNASTPFKSIEEGLIPNDVTIKLRVQNPYNQERILEDLNRITRCDVVEGLPSYEFEFTNKQALDLTQEEYTGALANVNVVPNPYYAYSAYETSQFVNTIKITNLPDQAIVTIYSLDGRFIRQFKRDERKMIKSGIDMANANTQTIPALEWDMKNFSGIPVASGVYLIHIAAPSLGEERTLKWFGINRKFDPTGL